MSVWPQFEKGAAIAEIERLFRVEKLPLEAISEKLKVSLTTVRRVCRTLGLGRYGFGEDDRSFIARSSQTPFGWNVEQGILRVNPTEMKWVNKARELRTAQRFPLSGFYKLSKLIS